MANDPLAGVDPDGQRILYSSPAAKADFLNAVSQASASAQTRIQWVDRSPVIFKIGFKADETTINIDEASKVNTKYVRGVTHPDSKINGQVDIDYIKGDKIAAIHEVAGHGYQIAVFDQKLREGRILKTTPSGTAIDEFEASRADLHNFLHYEKDAFNISGQTFGKNDEQYYTNQFQGK